MPLAGNFSTIIELFDVVTKKYANDIRPALRHKVGGKYVDISYTELRSRVENFAFGLAALGIKYQDNILMISENRPEWVIADMGMVHLGAVNVPLYTTLTPKQIEYIMHDASVRYAIVSNQMQLNKLLQAEGGTNILRTIIVMNEQDVSFDKKIVSFAAVYQKGEEFRKKHLVFLEEQKPKITPDVLLTIIYTSGTTGNPKGVMLTHHNLVSNIKAAAECISISQEDVLLSFLPLCHSYERMGGYYAAVACGGTIAYAESVETVRENMLEVKPTVITTVPRLFERIHSRIMRQVEGSPALRQKIFYWAMNVGKQHVKAKKNHMLTSLLRLKHAIADKLVFQKIRKRTGGRLRYFISGGAALPRELGEFFEAIGILILEGYGLTETSPVVSVNRLDDYKFGTVGKPIPGVEVRIVDDGEILARGPNVMKGYWNDKQSTEEIIDREGWLHTGDIGMIDQDGFLVITDRKKHIFVNSGGKNIAPQPIENLFLQSPYIDQFVLIGEKRMFCSALIVPNYEALREYCTRNNISYSSEEDLVAKKEIHNFFEKEIGILQKDLANFERVRKFTLLAKPLTVEDGEITPTLKVRRKVVEEKYRHRIEKMYESVK